MSTGLLGWQWGGRSCPPCPLSPQGPLGRSGLEESCKATSSPSQRPPSWVLGRKVLTACSPSSREPPLPGPALQRAGRPAGCEGLREARSAPLWQLPHPTREAPDPQTTQTALQSEAGGGHVSPGAAECDFSWKLKPAESQARAHSFPSARHPCPPPSPRREPLIWDSFPLRLPFPSPGSRSWGGSPLPLRSLVHPQTPLDTTP